MNTASANTFPRWRIAVLAIAVGAMSAGSYLAFMAWKRDSMSFAMWAVILLLASPALATAAWLAGRGPPPCDAGTPPHLLSNAERRADMSLRLIRGARAHAFVALSYAAVLWVCQLSGMISARGFVWFYTLTSIAAAAAYLPWLAGHEGRAHEQRQNCRRLLKDFKTATGWSVE